MPGYNASFQPGDLCWRDDTSGGILISMSLSSPTRVFVLGAGFSAQEGFPLIRGLRKRVLHYLEAERHSAYEVVLNPGNGGYEKGQFYAGLDSIDTDGGMEFEELLIALASRRRTATDTDPCHITDKVLKIDCARFLWCIQNSIWRAESAYQNFASQLRPGGDDAVISFNWDLLLEKALADNAIPWSYSTQGAGIPIVKPHGSINWSGHLREQLQAEYAGWRALGPGFKLSFDANEPLSNMDMQESNSDLRYMLYPGDSELPNEDGDVQWLWKQAEDAIRDRDLLVFIGYSLPSYDTYASQFFARFADKNIEVFTPSRDHRERYRHMFGADAGLFDQTFADCKYSRPIS